MASQDFVREFLHRVRLEGGGVFHIRLQRGAGGVFEQFEVVADVFRRISGKYRCERQQGKG